MSTNFDKLIKNYGHNISYIMQYKSKEEEKYIRDNLGEYNLIDSEDNILFMMFSEIMENLNKQEVIKSKNTTLFIEEVCLKCRRIFRHVYIEIDGEIKNRQNESWFTGYNPEEFDYIGVFSTYGRGNTLVIAKENDDKVHNFLELNNVKYKKRNSIIELQVMYLVSSYMTYFLECDFSEAFGDYMFDKFRGHKDLCDKIAKYIKKLMRRIQP